MFTVIGAESNNYGVHLKQKNGIILQKSVTH